MGLVLSLVPGLARGEPVARPGGKADAVEIVRYENQRSSARLEPARLSGRPGLAVVFQGTEDLHYYARAETAPAPGLQLKVEATAGGIKFGEAVFPPWQTFVDSAGKTVEVYVGDFRVFVPIRKPPVPAHSPRRRSRCESTASRARASCACLPSTRP